MFGLAMENVSRRLNHCKLHVGRLNQFQMCQPQGDHKTVKLSNELNGRRCRSSREVQLVRQH